MTWLLSIASEDNLSLAEAALVLVRNGVTIPAQEWSALSTDERAALTAARQEARALELEESGQDLAAARARVALDGGVAAARLMAQAAVAGVAESQRQAREGVPRAP